MHMTPKETLQAAFAEKVDPFLRDFGFVGLASQFVYQRKVGEFTQQISITLSHRNSAEWILWWSAFNVSSAAYNRWLKLRKRPAYTGMLVGHEDWNIPGWREEGDYSSGHQFGDPATRAAVLDDWMQRCRTVGIPFLDQLSTWHGAAEDLLRNQWHHDRAADYFEIADRPADAIAALAAGIETLRKQELPVSPNAHPILVAKRKREANARNARISEFEQRISALKNSQG
jgi:hypothetical protein